jgi:hypothetical protein
VQLERLWRSRSAIRARIDITLFCRALEAEKRIDRPCVPLAMGE